MKKNTTPLEEWEQTEYFKWVRANQIKIPELVLVNASMNGVRISSIGLRNKMKAQGMRKGIPDIDIPIARGKYHGLRIEMKRRQGGLVSKDQKIIHVLLREQGYLVEVCKGWQEAVKTTMDYLVK